MKKYEKLIKFIILIMPILICVFTAISLELQSADASTLYGTFESNIFGSLPTFGIFDDFNYFVLDLFADHSYVYFVLSFVEWWLFVEFAFLSKNVMCYIISLANKFLEKGVE